ncbi:30S ribosomal protein S8 [archaeon]|jgi:small subunit ribosomal protein S8|nr:30S ribosomal protein S8 [archaeon]MBT4397016.1 30S ribosomal protein S8 [archaeon]MBT4441007.1 30S ribosomal protein S8 [archaeon]
MAMNDTLAGTLNNIQNAETVGKGSCRANPVSKTAKKVLEIFKDNLYIGEFKIIENGKGDIFDITLIGRVNKCGVIKPRFSVKLTDYAKFEKRFLPAKDFGLIIVSTPKGIMTHTEAKEKRLGGKLLAFIY